MRKYWGLVSWGCDSRKKEQRNYCLSFQTTKDGWNEVNHPRDISKVKEDMLNGEKKWSSEEWEGELGLESES